MYAESVKASGRVIDEPTRMMLEVYIPSFSICSLLAVTGWIVYDASNVISGKDKEEDTNVYYLFGFSIGKSHNRSCRCITVTKCLFCSANFIVDVVSSCMFAYRGSAAFSSEESGQLYAAVPDSEDIVEVDPLVVSPSDTTTSSSTSSSSSDAADKKTIVWRAEQQQQQQQLLSSDGVQSSSSSSSSSRLNLNMCSALTHLGGDTLRTSSVFVAAIVASSSNADPNLCDAWAAIVVSLTTVALVLPLIYHICMAAAAASHYR